MEPVNPFADCGRMIVGERFLGRSRELATFRSRLLSPRRGNVAVVGLPRVGKSSLVRQALAGLRADLHARRVLATVRSVGEFPNPRELFHALVHNTNKQIVRCGWGGGELTVMCAQVGAALSEPEGVFSELLHDYFSSVKDLGIGLLFVLDEFDGVREWKDRDGRPGGKAPFQRLRTLCTEPEFDIALVTASRRSVSVLEEVSGGLSTLVNVMEELYLKPFTPDEAAPFFDRCADAGASLTATDADTVRTFTGLHPYLLDMVGFHLVQGAQSSAGANAGAAIRAAAPSVLDQYEELFRVLRDAELLDKMAQILFGPVYKLNRADQETLQRYGLLVPDGNQFRAFSEHFQQCLRAEVRDIDYWAEWQETEVTLRRFVGAVLTDRLGPNWVAEVLNAKPGLRSLLERCQRMQDDERASFGLRASPNLLDYTYPLDLFRLMNVEWNWFKSAFPNKTKLEDELKYLNEFRRPLAHNRDLSQLDEWRAKAELICRDLRARIEAATGKP